jgi:hypothetical protein
MNIDHGKSIENFNDIPEFYREMIQLGHSHTTGCYQSSFNKLNFYY